MNADTLLADPTTIEIEKFVALDDAILIVAHSIQKAAICPQYDEPSSSLKSRYLRQLGDLPWHGVAVRLELKARKFRCRNELCSQKVFCEHSVNIAKRMICAGEMFFAKDCRRCRRVTGEKPFDCKRCLEF